MGSLKVLCLRPLQIEAIGALARPEMKTDHDAATAIRWVTKRISVLSWWVTHKIGGIEEMLRLIKEEEEEC